MSTKKLRVRIAAQTNTEQKAPITTESGRGFKLYSTRKTWFLRPGRSSMVLPIQVRAVLEYWSIGVLAKTKAHNKLNWSFHYSITPPLHHSSRLPQGGKSMGGPSGGSAKPGPLGPDYLLLLSSCWHLVEMNISLRERYGHTLGIKTLFNAAGYIPVYVPIIISFYPWPDNKINRGIA